VISGEVRESADSADRFLRLFLGRYVILIRNPANLERTFFSRFFSQTNQETKKKKKRRRRNEVAFQAVTNCENLIDY